MSYSVTDDEKRQAERAILFFNHASKLLNKASDYLNIMKTSFKAGTDMAPKDVMETRAAFRRFRDKSIDNFNLFKQAAFKCVNIMQSFSSDTQTVKLMKSFISSIDDLEVYVNDFGDLFSDLENQEFSKLAINSIELIQKQCDEVYEIIDERIKSHIQSNILSSSWVDSVGSDLEMKIDKKTPLILDLFNKRQDQLNKIIKDKKI